MPNHTRTLLTKRPKSHSRGGGVAGLSGRGGSLADIASGLWNAAKTYGPSLLTGLKNLVTSDTGKKIASTAATAAADYGLEKALGTKKAEAERHAATERRQAELALEAQRRQRELDLEFKTREMEAARTHSRRAAEEDRQAEEDRRRLLRSGPASSQSRQQADQYVLQLESRYPNVFAAYPQYRAMVKNKALDALSLSDAEDPFTAQKVLGDLEFSIAQIQNRLNPGGTSPLAPKDVSNQLSRSAPRVADWLSSSKPKQSHSSGLSVGGGNRGRTRVGGGLSTVIRP